MRLCEAFDEAVNLRAFFGESPCQSRRNSNGQGRPRFILVATMILERAGQ